MSRDLIEDLCNVVMVLSFTAAGQIALWLAVYQAFTVH
jgi:hypothetical protein